MDGSTAKPRLREQVRAVMRLHHYSIRTEKFLLVLDSLLYPLSPVAPSAGAGH